MKRYEYHIVEKLLNLQDLPYPMQELYISHQMEGYEVEEDLVDRDLKSIYIFVYIYIYVLPHSHIPRVHRSTVGPT